MSRSKHTDPGLIRAARRIRAPCESRGANDASRRRHLGRAVKGLGEQPVRPDNKVGEWLGPRFVTRRPAPGFHHPVGKTQVLQVLETVGPLACYGLRSVEFARRPHDDGSSALRFGRYQAPGRILLFEQPCPPWRLAGRLSTDDSDRLERAGALITVLPAGATRVEWPEPALRQFMLEEVLLHELGHHVLQHNEGKRSVRMMRTGDHEAFARRFAAQHRSALGAKGGPCW